MQTLMQTLKPSHPAAISALLLPSLLLSAMQYVKVYRVLLPDSDQNTPNTEATNLYHRWLIFTFSFC